MKVGIFSDKSAPFFVGGYETRAFELARRLRRRNEVRVFTSLPASTVTADGVCFSRVAPTTFIRASGTSRSFAHTGIYSLCLSVNPLKQWKPDVLIVEAIPYSHLLAMRRWVSELCTLKVLSVNEAWFAYPFLRGPAGELATRLVRKLLRAGIGWADLVVAISRVTGESLQRNYGVPSPLIVPMGIDKLKINSLAPAREGQRTYDFACMARLVAIKRVDDFLRGLKLLKDRQNWKGRAVVVGDGPQRASLEREAFRLGIDSNVTFVGWKTEAEKYRLLRDTNAFVLASEREGFSLSTLEAMACGAPAIVARPPFPEVFGTSDFVHQGRTGLYFNVGAIDDLAECMAYSLNSPKEWSDMASRTEAVASQYDWGRLVDEFELALRARLGE